MPGKPELTRSERLLRNTLITLEEKHGGVRRVTGGVKSPLDPRTTHGTMRGGDRMSFHGYADFYAKYLITKLGMQLVVVEFGILNGTGLKIWDDLFPTSRIIGFDIDLSNLDPDVAIRKNVEVYELDQFKDNTTYIEEILNGSQVDIVIDDGCHVDDAILRTYLSISPYMHKKSLYFIEDNFSVREKGLLKFRDYHGRITLL